MEESNMVSIHDNEIVSYEVNFKKGRIKINTKNSQENSIVILFDEVLTHLFKHEMSNSILFDIEKYEMEEFIKYNEKLLNETKDYCWPINYDTIKELKNKLIEGKYNYYVISSSLGLNGWVLAKEMTIQEEL